MKVFISHSMKDAHLVDALRSIAASAGIVPLIAEHVIDLQNTVTKKIEEMISDADLVLVVLTNEGFNSTFVQQEIGYATKSNKPLLVLVEQGCEQRISGFIYGRDSVIIDPWNPHPAFEKVTRVLTSQRQEKEKQESIRTLLFAGLGILFLVSMSKN